MNFKKTFCVVLWRSGENSVVPTTLVISSTKCAWPKKNANELSKANAPLSLLWRTYKYKKILATSSKYFELFLSTFEN